MALAQLVVNALIAITLGAIGLYLASNYRIQTRIRLLELRVHAYRTLFALTEVAIPTRLGRGEAWSPDEERRLGRAIYDWYYENGNGLLMPNSTRAHLQSLQQKLQGEPLRRQSDDRSSLGYRSFDHFSGET
jgi:hypothetical protein